VGPQRLTHGGGRGDGPLDLALGVRRHFFGGAVVRGIDHGERQVARAVNVSGNDPELRRHVWRDRRQDIARHPRQGRSRDARNHQVFLKGRN